jgi:flagellar biosynthetic protein FliP
MTATTTVRRRPWLRFALHYVEMVVAMFVGMFALAPLWPTLVSPAAEAMVMATNMAIGMSLWMKIRRHSWRHIVEMSAAMYLPFVALLVPYWLGVVSGPGLMMLGHILMFPAMLAAMLWRRGDH